MNSETVVIQDPAGTARARIFPRLGFNCFSFEVLSRGEWVDLLWSDPEFTTGNKRATRSGIPILFPFAGRLRGTTFSYEGQEYHLERVDELGNAIHGFVVDHPWRVIDQAADRVVGEFHAAVDEPSVLERWPADFRIRVTYQVAQAKLHAHVELENPDHRPLPCGLGLHGYYRVPLGQKPSAADCVVRVPVRDRWELVDLLPTGRREKVEIAERLTAGMPFGQTDLNDVFGGMKFSQGMCTTSILDAANGRMMTMTFDQFFRVCVVFNPPHRQAICYEPYSTVPDAFTLTENGIDAGLLTIAPGASLETSFEIALRDNLPGS